MPEEKSKNDLYIIYMYGVGAFLVVGFIIWLFGDGRSAAETKPEKSEIIQKPLTPAEEKPVNTAKPAAEKKNVCSITPLKHDFGKLTMGQIVSHTFKVEVPQGQGLWLGRLGSPCECVSLQAKQKAWPDGKGYVTVRINTEDLYGKHDYPFFIQVIQPKNEVIKGTITVDLPEEQKVKPKKKVEAESEWITPAVMDFGKMLEGQSATKTFTVKNLHPKTARLERLMSPCPCVTVSADKNVLKPNETCVITVNMHSMSLNGKVEYPVLMRLVADEAKLIRGDLKIEVQRVPSKILLSTDALSLGKLKKDQARSFKLTNLQKKPLVVKSVKCNVEGIALELPESLLVAPGKVFEIKLKSDGKKKGYFDGMLSIETDCNEHALIKVPIEGSF